MGQCSASGTATPYNRQPNFLKRKKHEHCVYEDQTNLTFYWRQNEDNRWAARYLQDGSSGQTRAAQHFS